MWKLLVCFGSISVGAIFLGMGTLIALLSQAHAFECRRLEPLTNKGQCELGSRGILGSESLSLPIESLQDADIEKSVTRWSGRSGASRRTTTTYRIVILTTEGNFPLSQSSNSERNKNQAEARKIRTFIDTKAQMSLSIGRDDRRLGYLFGGIFAGIGATLILGVPISLLRGCGR